MKDSEFSLNLRCKDCVFWEKFSKDGKPCKEKGILGINKASSCFSIDPYEIDFEEQKALKFVKKLLKGVSTKKISLLAALIQQEEKTREYGFSFGQEVFIRAFGTSDYISNFAKAYVILATKNAVFVQGRTGFKAMFPHSGVLNLEQFNKRKYILAKRRKIIDPNLSKYTKDILKEQKYLDETYLPKLLKKIRR